MLLVQADNNNSPSCLQVGNKEDFFKNLYSTSVLAKVTFHYREKALPSLTLMVLSAHFHPLCTVCTALQT